MAKRSFKENITFCPQPMYLIGTYREDGKPNFCPITWISYTFGPPNSLVVSMYGKKLTKDNVMRTGVFSANLVSSDMLELADYFGSADGYDGEKKAIPYAFSRGQALNVPILDKSRWVYECRVIKTVELGECHTFFCEIKNIQVEESVVKPDTEISHMMDLIKLDSVIYARDYYKIGEKIGKIGEVYQAK